MSNIPSEIDNIDATLDSIRSIDYDMIRVYLRTYISGEHPVGARLYNVIRYMASNGMDLIIDTANRLYTIGNLLYTYTTTYPISTRSIYNIASCFLNDHKYVPTIQYLMYCILNVDMNCSNAYYVLATSIGPHQSIIIGGVIFTKTLLYYMALVLDMYNYDKAVALAANMTDEYKFYNGNAVVTRLDILVYAISLDRKRPDAYLYLLTVADRHKTYNIGGVNYSYDKIIEIYHELTRVLPVTDT